MKKFTGPLGQKREPIKIPPFTEEQRAEIQRLTMEEDIRCMALLMDHYGLAPAPTAENLYALTLALARDFVPAFQEAGPRGRPKKWTDFTGSLLVVEIERLQNSKKPKRGPRWAAHQLVKREPWASFIDQKEASEFRGDTAEAARQKYHEFSKNVLVPVLRDAYKLHVHQDTIERWDEFLLESVRK